MNAKARAHELETSDEADPIVDCTADVGAVVDARELAPLPEGEADDMEVLTMPALLRTAVAPMVAESK